MQICFFGLGGVGGYFGTLFTKKFIHDHDIFFVARGRHKEAICKSGLTLKKSGGEEIINVTPTRCVENTSNLPICDIIVLSVKSYDLPDAVIELSRIVDNKTVVIPLLNGVDIYDRIRQHLSKGIVLPSCVYVGTHIESPGIVFQKGGNCRILTGKDPQNPDIFPRDLLELFKSADIAISWEKNVEISIWTKFMFIAGYGLVAALYEKTLGQIMDSNEMSQQVIGIMKEIYITAIALGIQLESKVVDDSYNKARQFPYETKTSFQRDIELKGKINEGDLFGGAIIRYGNSLAIATPITNDVYTQLMLKTSILN
jgi:2-dehydropantoate 2-reductase